jgi:SOS-response transcriptional repressor LexA
MMPLIHSGYILVVDTSQTSRLKLQGQIVIAAQKEEGLIVSRLQRFDETDVLVPENREYDSTPISASGWRIIAKVLWWIGHPNNNEAFA